MTDPSAGESRNGSKMHLETAIQLSDNSKLVLAGLPVEQRTALIMKYGEKVIELAVRQRAKAHDVQVLGLTMDELARTCREVADSGSHVTIEHTENTDHGRTIITLGNTSAAGRGPSRSLTGGRDYTLVWIAVALIAFLAIVIAIVKLAK